MWILFLAISIAGFVTSLRASRTIEAFVNRAGVKDKLQASTFPPYNGKYFGIVYRDFYAKYADDKKPLSRFHFGYALFITFLLLAGWNSGFFGWFSKLGERIMRRELK